MITRQEVWMEMAGADQCHFPMAWEATPSWAPCSLYILGHIKELELELIQTHMAQKPMLRVEVGARFVAQSGWKRGGVWRLAHASECARCGGACACTCIGPQAP